MSDITGNGYGDNHNWERKETYQNNNQIERATRYRCKNCQESFRHYYHVENDIFEAMKKLNITEECNTKGVKE